MHHHITKVQINALRSISASIGKDFALVQGAGGNSSIKDDKHLIVKASGYQLKDALDKDIFVMLNMDAVKSCYAKNQEDLTSCMLGDTNKRPSIEAMLHALIPYRYVFHIHDLRVIAALIQPKTLSQLTHMLKDMPCCLIPYHKPGMELAKALDIAVSSNNPKIFLLQNHGIVFASDDLEEIPILIREVEARLPLNQRSLNYTIDPLRHPIKGYRLPSFPEINALALDPISLQVAAHVLYPDFAVFLSHPLCVCKVPEEVERVIQYYHKHVHTLPTHIILKGHCVLVQESLLRNAEEMLKALAIISSYIQEPVDIHHLSEVEIAELTHWDAEIYRKNLLASEV